MSAAPAPPAPRLFAVLFGALFIGVLSALPLVNVANCCCLWRIGGGVLTAWILQQHHRFPITLADGAVAGLLAGLASAFVYIVIAWPIHLLLDPWMEGWIEQALMSGRDVPDEARDLLRQLASGRGAFAVLFLMQLVLAAIFSTLGGLVGAAMFRRTSPPPLPDVPIGA